MCIIVAVPANTPMPTADTIRECFISNPDGAGFMYADGKSVHIRKGFMEFADFMEALESENIPTDSAVVMHFRIATHGKVQPSCCHPFPVSSDKEDLKATKISARWGVAHNGIIHGRSTSNDWSDSMDFIHGVIVPLARMNPAFIHSDDAIEMLENACNSKLAILDNAGDLALVGDFIEDEGVFYSNTTYLPIRSNWSSYGDWWSRSTDATYYDEPWDDVEKLLAKLPYEACQLCDNCESCAWWEVECSSRAMAVKACAYYSGLDENDVADLCGLDAEELGTFVYETDWDLD